jgi:hypothetical protein
MKTCPNRHVDSATTAKSAGALADYVYWTLRLNLTTTDATTDILRD